MRIVFFGTSNIAAPFLEHLHQTQEILAVITAPNAKAGRKQTLSPSPVSRLADALKLRVFKPAVIKGNQTFLEELKKLAPGLAIVVDYGKILPAKILDIPKFKTLNVHFSLLPKFRGPSPIQTALIDGQTQTGTSIFILDEKVDAGPVLAQQQIIINHNDNYTTLAEKLTSLSIKLLSDTIPAYAAGKITPVGQDEFLATYTKLIGKDDGRIDWNKSAIQIYNQFRAFYHWPGVWSAWQDKNLKILDCLPVTPPSPLSLREGQSSGFSPLPKGELAGVIPGTVLDGGVVACGEKSFLQINRLQLAGKSPTDIKSFLNGHKNFIGSQLG